MKINLPVTQHEQLLPAGTTLVSVTDLKGRITYCNRVFIEFSGYSEAELLGAQHNIVRHPDMPRGVFKFLWDTLGAGNECFAFVKNMSRDGSFYWVLANVTPNLSERGEVEGYFSARRKPSRGAVAAMSDLYRQMLAEEQRAGSRDACDASLAVLTTVLTQKGVSYEQFVLSI